MEKLKEKIPLIPIVMPTGEKKDIFIQVSELLKRKRNPNRITRRKRL